MISTDRVLSLAHSFYGVDEKESGVRTLCSVVCSEIKQMMRPGVDDNDVRILILCAAKLNSRLLSSDTDERGVTSFEAGDVSVSFDTSASSRFAEKELSDAMASAAPLLTDCSFLFRQVRV